MLTTSATSRGLDARLRSMVPALHRALAYSLFSLFTIVMLVVPPGCAWAECDRFVRLVADAVDRYHEHHRVHPVDQETRNLAVRWMPRLWTTPESWKPIDFDRYLAKAKLRADDDGRVLAEPPITAALTAMDRVEQCKSFLESPEIESVDPAPVYIQAFRDAGPASAFAMNPEPGRARDSASASQWLYLKYTFVFDWSGLARERGFLARMGAVFAGGEADRWHRLDVHTSAILGLDGVRRLRTLTLQQHNNQRTYVAGIDFDPSEGLHIAAASGTNELYLDTGSSQPQRRRAVPTFLQWKHLINGRLQGAVAQVDEFRGRNAGGEETRLRPVFPDPDYPLAAYAGTLAPKRRMLGLYVGRDGPPGFDFTLPQEMPDTAELGYWHEDDDAFLAVLDEHLAGFETTNWESIRRYLSARLASALATTDDR